MADTTHTYSRTPPAGSRRAPRWIPVVLMAAGAACLVYGFAFHSVTVQPKAEAADAAPEEPPADDVPPEILPDEEPVFSPDVLFGEGPAEAVPMPVEDPEDVEESPPPEPYAFSEARVVKEVTIGGLHRLPTGEIARTYGPNEKAPTFCPT
jgi:hypothetical protein